MKRILLAVLLCANCAPKTETETPVTPTPVLPNTIRLDSGVGQGVDGGQATVTASVRDGFARGMSGVDVAFSASTGSLSPEHTMTDARGVATTTLTASPGAVKVEATAAALGLAASVLVAVQAPAADPAPTPIPAPPPIPPPPTPAPTPLSAIISATEETVGTPTTFVAVAVGGAFPETFAWTFGDGTTATTNESKTTHQYAAAGTYSASVTITDARSRVASASTDVKVNAPAPTPPPAVPSYTVALAASPSSVSINVPTTLTATVTPLNGASTPTGFLWDCGNGGATTTTATNTTTCTFATTGSKTASVTASAAGVTGSATTTITATPPPAPVVTVSCAQVTAPPARTANCVVSATISGVQMPSSTITNVDWDFGDSQQATTTTNTTQHPYAGPATYQIVVRNVTVTGAGSTGTGNTSVVIQ